MFHIVIGYFLCKDKNKIQVAYTVETNSIIITHMANKSSWASVVKLFQHIVNNLVEYYTICSKPQQAYCTL